MSDTKPESADTGGRLVYLECVLAALLVECIEAHPRPDLFMKNVMARAARLIETGGDRDDPKERAEMEVALSRFENLSGSMISYALRRSQAPQKPS